MIWNSANAQISAPIDDKPVKFQKLFNNPYNSRKNITLYVIADNAPTGGNTVSINGKLVGTINDGGWVVSPANYSPISAVLEPGINLIEIQAQNMGGPAGLIVIGMDSDKKLPIFRTDNTWSYIDPNMILPDCQTVTAGPYDSTCLTKWLNETGCPVIPQFNQADMTYFNSKTPTEIKNEFKNLALQADESSMTKCYGTDKSKWPARKVIQQVPAEITQQEILTPKVLSAIDSEMLNTSLKTKR